jgi:hypothetical protein
MVVFPDKELKKMQARPILKRFIEMVAKNNVAKVKEHLDKVVDFPATYNCICSHTRHCSPFPPFASRRLLSISKWQPLFVRIAAHTSKGLDPNFQDDDSGETPLSIAASNDLVDMALTLVQVFRSLPSPTLSSRRKLSCPPFTFYLFM